MKPPLHFISALVIATCALASPAFANVVIPYGDAIVAVGEGIKPTIETAISGVILTVLLKYAGPFGMLIRNNFVQDIIKRAVDFGFASTFGAARGKTLTLETSNAVIQNALRYAEGHFPWVLRWIIGGATKMIEKAVATMVNELPEDFVYAPAAPKAK